MALLSVNNLSVKFKTKASTLTAVSDVSLSVEAGETLCIVGESGCGKSVTAMTIMGLIKNSTQVAVEGEIFFDKMPLHSLSSSEQRAVRGSRIAMIFQDPMTSLNPVFTCGFQIAESLIFHKKITKKEAYERAVELLKSVGIPDPDKRVHQYPHELSGGMRQRVMIAMALACDPELLIADEPTTALDVTVQAQILELLTSLCKSRKMSLLFITHDLGIVAGIADRVAVFYAGKIVETGNVTEIYQSPRHRYTEGLLSSIPALGSKHHRLKVIPGTLPDPTTTIAGCSFNPRCESATDICRISQPPISTTGSHSFTCFNPAKEEM